MPGDVPAEPAAGLLDNEDENVDQEAAEHQMHAAGVDHHAEELQDLSDDDLDINLHSGWLFVHDTDSEEEADLDENVGQKITRTRVHESRPEYQELDKLGLVARPPGCSIGVHPGAKVWRASAPSGSNHGRSFSETAGRNAKQALMRVVELMLTDYLTGTKDRQAKVQLERIKDLRSKEPSHKD